MELFRRYPWRFSLAYLVATAGIVYGIHASFGASRPREVYFSEFVSEVRAGHIRDIKITEAELIGVLQTPGSADAKIRAPRLPGQDLSSLLKEFEANNVRFTGYERWNETPAVWLLPLLLLVVIYLLAVWRVRQGAGSLLGLTRHRGKIYEKSTTSNITFNDVAGVDESKAELVEIVDFLRNPAKYERLGGRVPKGVLLIGPPGTGKTLLAKAVAGEAGVPFFSISGSEFVEMYVGVGAARVRSLFHRAKQKAPAIIFIDELDAIGKSRSSDRRPLASHDERDQTLNQLLVEMDGFETTTVIVLAATNTPEVLDQALVRPGRFDRHVLVDKADLKGREAILKIHARNVELAPDVDLGTIAARTPGMVGADLANIINEAAILGARRNAQRIEMVDLEEAIDRVMLGLEKKNRVMSPAVKERVAYHETGHALVALSVEHADPVHRVSIIPRAIGALGHVLQLPTEEKYLMTQPEIEDQIAVMLGGRVSEEIIFDGVVSTGASNDLERASELARQIVTRYGMSRELGLLTYGRSQGGRYLQSLQESEDRNYSEATAERIDQEARRIIDASYARVLQILGERRDDLERIARALMERETLDRNDLERLLASAA